MRVIRAVHAGERPISSDVAARLEARKMLPSLTPREVEVVRLIAQGDAQQGDRRRARDQ